MKLRISNDGKGKANSWEAWFENRGKGWAVHANGYGATEEAARSDLSCALMEAAFACNADVINSKPTE